METTRKDALKWWNAMNLEQQFYVLIKNKELFSWDQSWHPHSLTGRQIEMIYLEVTQ